MERKGLKRSQNGQQSALANNQTTVGVVNLEQIQKC